MAVEVLLFEPRLLGALDTCSGPADRGEGRSTEGGGQAGGGQPQSGVASRPRWTGALPVGFLSDSAPTPHPTPRLCPQGCGTTGVREVPIGD